MKKLNQERNKKRNKKYSYNELALAFYKQEITLEEYLKRYNSLIAEESERYAEPFEPHEYI